MSTAPTSATTETEPASAGGVDPRGPRFAATLTALLLVVVVFLSLTTGTALDAAALASQTPLQRLLEPAALGLLLHVLGAPFALPVAAAAAFIAAFLNAAFGFCLGCEIYLLLRRARLIRA